MYINSVPLSVCIVAKALSGMSDSRDIAEFGDSDQFSESSLICSPHPTLTSWPKLLAQSLNLILCETPIEERKVAGC